VPIHKFCVFGFFKGGSERSEEKKKSDQKLCVFFARTLWVAASGKEVLFEREGGQGSQTGKELDSNFVHLLKDVFNFFCWIFLFFFFFFFFFFFWRRT
jgi:hypothetical protein